MFKIVPCNPRVWRRLIDENESLNAGQKILANLVLDDICGLLHEKDYYGLFRDAIEGKQVTAGIIAAAQALIAMLNEAIRVAEIQGGDSCLN